MTVGERLKDLRNKIGLSQQELSDRIGIRRATYARYETNANQADYDTIIKLANFFNVTTDYILSGNSHLQYKNFNQKLIDIFNDPEIQSAFNEIPGSTEDVKREILDILRYIKFKKSNKS